MTAHPSLFELHHFVSSGESSGAFEAHVSRCEACAGRLSDVARRVAVPLIDVQPLEQVQTQRALMVMVMALMATLALMMMQSIRLPSVSIAPEGTHGVGTKASVESAPSLVQFSEGDSGVR